MAPFKQRHLLSSSYKCGARLNLLQQPGGPEDGGWLPGDAAMASGQVAEEVRGQLLMKRRRAGGTTCGVLCRSHDTRVL
jgi:hypothetical protein